MKRVLVALPLIALAVSGFAQGKIGLQNPAVAPVTLSSNLGESLSADAALAGLPIGNSSALPSGRVLAIGLYAGIAKDALSYYMGDSGTALLNNPIGTPGLVNLQHIRFTNPLILGNTTAFGQIRVWDSTYANYEATPTNAYRGESAVFTFTTKLTTYMSIAPSVPAEPIVVGIAMPEPTVAAIAGLGLASMLIFRRKKA